MIEIVWRGESACFTIQKSLFCTSKQALLHHQTTGFVKH